MAGDQGPAKGGGTVSVESKIVSALAPFGDPVEKSLLYAAAQDLPPQYYTFSCSSFGADFGDDAPGCERWLVKGYFYPRVQAALGNDTAQTKTDSITFGTTNTTFTVFPCESGDWRITEEFNKEVDCKAWVKEKLGAEPASAGTGEPEV